MKSFLDNDFLLENKVAQELYHEVAANMPIYDYHTHLSPEDIQADRIFNDLGEVWLSCDHYKWRAMRSAGIPEEYVTGKASFREKFFAWADIVPMLIGNPLYHWTHLELRRYFGIEEVLSSSTAEKVYNRATEMLQSREFSVRSLLKRMNVTLICTTDDPVSSLSPHRELAREGFPVKVLPTFRPDSALNYYQPAAWNVYIDELSEVSGIDIVDFWDYLEALKKRVDFFHESGCRISDHAMLAPVYNILPEAELKKAFSILRSGKDISLELQKGLYTHTLLFLGKLYHERNWAMQIHIGALRNNNTRLFESFGPDVGCDSIGDLSIAESLARFLDTLDRESKLPRTILYVLNPRDNYVLGTMIGNFQDGSIPGKIQFGSAWWFNDQRDGIESQLKALANLGVLSSFVGMLTDSRSFMSFPRHEYFRRVFCNLIGKWVESGEYPYDRDILELIVKKVSYKNACFYFDIPM
ncbi:glucuronate isomerase [Spirochaetia bacterium 38H-sp]|uniref:Uronate isomerase n=1 Tax=Rarispira pelagica TaxID=3141764 RepID=A0ABU9UAA6_9SPIR